MAGNLAGHHSRLAMEVVARVALKAVLAVAATEGPVSRDESKVCWGSWASAALTDRAYTDLA